MSNHQVHVFISHSWDYTHHYDTLAGWIFGERWSSGQASIDFRNYSVPSTNPIHNAPNAEALRLAIFNQIARCHVVVIPTGMYAHYSKWIRKEIDGAAYYGKPIVAVNPWGQQRGSGVVSAAASRTVGWNKQPVVDAIWDLHFRGV